MITQRLVLRNGEWSCAGCRATVSDGELAHPGNCPELGEKIARAAEAIARPQKWPVPRPRASRESTG